MQSDMFLVTPMTQQMSDLEPGQTYNGSIRIANPANSTNDFSFEAHVSPYSVVGEDYSADLATKSNRTMITDWITLEDASGTLHPNETSDVKFTITVPENAPAGAQYATIVVSQQKSANDRPGMNIDNIAEMASIIYADVAGETVHEGNILENNVPGFTTSVPVAVSAKFDNHGNVHDEAVIMISAKNLITGETILPTDNNPGQYSELIIPDTTRSISRNVDSLPFLGIVHLEQTIYYNGHSSTEAKDLIICPIWFMVTVAVTIIALIALIVRLVLRHRRKSTAFDLD